MDAALSVRQQHRASAAPPHRQPEFLHWRGDQWDGVRARPCAGIFRPGAPSKARAAGKIRRRNHHGYSRVTEAVRTRLGYSVHRQGHGGRGRSLLCFSALRRAYFTPYGADHLFGQRNSEAKRGLKSVFRQGDRNICRFCASVEQGSVWSQTMAELLLELLGLILEPVLDAIFQYL